MEKKETISFLTEPFFMYNNRVHQSKTKSVKYDTVYERLIYTVSVPAMTEEGTIAISMDSSCLYETKKELLNSLN